MGLLAASVSAMVKVSFSAAIGLRCEQFYFLNQDLVYFIDLKHWSKFFEENILSNCLETVVSCLPNPSHFYLIFSFGKIVSFHFNDF